MQLPQLDTSARCCDDIYLPTLLTDSVLDFPGGNFYYRILTHPGGYVSWSVKVLATYYTSLSFRAFPFDKQLLTVLFRVPEFQEYADGRVRFVPSVAGALLCMHVCLCVTSSYTMSATFSHSHQQPLSARPGAWG